MPETETKIPPMRLRVDLPGAAADALREAALRERRSMPDQAAWIIIRTLQRRARETADR